jgi:hypothetical protein
MKPLIGKDGEAAVLPRRCGATAQLWMFHVSYKRLALRLCRKGDAEELCVVAIAYFLGDEPEDAVN